MLPESVPDGTCPSGVDADGAEAHPIAITTVSALAATQPLLALGVLQPMATLRAKVYVMYPFISSPCANRADRGWVNERHGHVAC